MTKRIFIFLFQTYKKLQYITFTIHYNKFKLLVAKFYLTLKQKTVSVYRREKSEVKMKRKTKSTKIL